ncbi:MAG: hypothetical protein ABIV13_05805 [Fimbriimonadales bacterium]
MFHFLAQTEPPGTNFWAIERTGGSLLSQQAFMFILGAFIVTILLIFAISRIPSNFRKPITVGVTFFAGLFYVLEFLWPRHITAGGQATQSIFGLIDLQEAQGIVNPISQVLTGFLLALGVLSIFRVHFGRLFKKQKDWFFSLVLLGSLFSIFILGMISFAGDLSMESRQASIDAGVREGVAMDQDLAALARLGSEAQSRSVFENTKSPTLRAFQKREIERAEYDRLIQEALASADEANASNEAVIQAALDGGTLTAEAAALAKDGLTEQKARTGSEQAFQFLYQRGLLAMDAAMFSLIGFFILSAAYRAFRVRSIEASILMATALVVLLMFVPIALMLTSGLDPDSFAGNFRIDSVGSWLLSTINVPAIRAIDLGLGLGLLAMGLRIMLGLEKGVASE